MNKHIELVNRYSADNDSVSIQELHANFDSAADASDAAAAALSNAIDTCKAACNVVNALEVIVDAAFAADMEAADALVAAQKAFFEKRTPPKKELGDNMKITKRELNMNKNIELIKRWIADNDSVSYKELRDNMDDAVRASELVDAVVYAADYAMADYPEDAAYWVNICEELIAGIDSTLGDPSSVSVPHDDLPMSEHIKQLVKQGR